MSTGYDTTIRAADVLITPSEVTEQFGVPATTVAEWTKSGQLPVVRKSNTKGARRYVREAQVCALLQSGGAR